MCLTRCALLAFHFLYRGELSHRTQKLTMPQYFSISVWGRENTSVSVLVPQYLVSIPQYRTTVGHGPFPFLLTYLSNPTHIDRVEHREDPPVLRAISLRGTDTKSPGRCPRGRKSSRARRHGAMPELTYSIPCQWAFCDFTELSRLHLACCLMTILA